MHHDAALLPLESAKLAQDRGHFRLRLFPLAQLVPHAEVALVVCVECRAAFARDAAEHERARALKAAGHQRRLVLKEAASANATSTSTANSKVAGVFSIALIASTGASTAASTRG
eukprot:5952270-Pleurochrysis_carterae.AAC.1